MTKHKQAKHKNAMKKHISVLILFTLFSFSVYAQNKQVAIFETLGNVSQGIKSSLRNNMIYAITNTSGYEAFDRVNIAEIMDEHEFMNSGFVDEAGRKKLGQMIGAGYILILEAAIDEHGQILISADIESVETGFIEKSAMGTAQNFDDMEHVCMKLSRELFPEISHKTATSQQPAVSQNTNVPHKTQKSVAKVIIFEPVNKDGRISYSTKAVLKTNLGKAISNISGLESITAKETNEKSLENKFSLPHEISEEQMDDIAKQTGASYALLSEATINEQEILTVSSTLFDLTSHTTASHETVNMSNTPQDILNGCHVIAKKIKSDIFTTKVIVFDIYTKDSEIGYSTKSLLKSEFNISISNTHGFESIANDEVDLLLFEAGYLQNPRISKEQAITIESLSGARFALLTEASISSQDNLIINIKIVNLDAYTIEVQETTKMKNAPDDIRRECERLMMKALSNISE